MSGPGSYLTALEGNLEPGTARFAIVVARFHGEITEVLLQSALGGLREHGADESQIEVFRVPGAWEIPQVVRAAAESGRFDAVVALGCVIQGETPHFDYICSEVARGLGAVAESTGKSIIFGVLTTLTREQAWARADPEGQDKGREAALAALEMIGVVRRARGEVT
jgi:6,7-dimethyl-8-ribityllumazine synthase